MPTPATFVWRPSTARVVVLDGFVPVPRGSTYSSLPPLAWAVKDPADILDYVLDLSPAFYGNDGDGIADIDVTISPGQPGDLSLNRASADGTSIVLWLSAGQAGTTYSVTVSVVANSGRTISRSVQLPVASLAVTPAASTALQTDSGEPLTDQNSNPVLAP
jgi:hypothetical protein